MKREQIHFHTTKFTLQLSTSIITSFYNNFNANIIIKKKRKILCVFKFYDHFSLFNYHLCHYKIEFKDAKYVILFRLLSIYYLGQCITS